MPRSTVIHPRDVRSAVVLTVLGSICLGVPAHGQAIRAKSDKAVAAGQVPAIHPAAPKYPLWDVAANGTIWARGSNYKAAFSSAGMKHIAAGGTKASGDPATRFALKQARIGEIALELSPAAAAVRDGSRITIDRGSVIEVYDVAADAVEQSFILNAIPASGDLTLTIGAETSMARSAKAEGLAFAGARSETRYGNATAIDGDGQTIPAVTRLSNGDVEIVVPASFLATAKLPLVIDPIISAFTAENNGGDSIVSDVSYDASTQSFFVTWEISFSENDGDVYADTFNDIGQSLNTFSAIDISEDNWRNPSCANNNIADAFLVAAEVGLAPNRTIKSRVRSAGSTATGPITNISSFEQGDKHDCDVGGDPYMLGPTFFCVIWQRDLSANDTDIHARLVDSAGAAVGAGITTISNSGGTLDIVPAISKSDGAGPSAGQVWSIVWERDFAVGDSDIYGAQISWNGVVTTPAFAIDVSEADHHHPTVSTTLDSLDVERAYLVAYDEPVAAMNRDIIAQVHRGDTQVAAVNLSQMQGARQEKDQHTPVADADGTHFIVAHDEMYDVAPDDYDIFVSSFCLMGNGLAGSEHRRVIAGHLGYEDRAAMATAHGAGAASPVVLISWHYDSPFDAGNTGAGFYQSRPTCGCAADITANWGEVDVSDLLAVIQHWGPCNANVFADINGDQFVNVTDLLMVITQWGHCQ